MGINLDKLKGSGSRAGRFLVAGALAAALTPAMAFATGGALQAQGGDAASALSVQHYEPQNNTGKVVYSSDNGDPLDHGVKLVSSEGNSHTYMGYVHTDGSHYKGYTLYTTVTTNDEGILTDIDITSSNETFAGMWGYLGSDAIEGFLPDGVSFNSIKNADGTYAVGLSNAADYKPTLSVTLISTNATGTADALGVDQNFDGSRKVQSGRSTVTVPHFTSTALASVDANAISVPSTAEGVVTTAGTTETGTVEDPDYYNLIKCTYSFGYDKNQFNAYASIGKYASMADDYIDAIGETVWAEDGNNTTNRDGWTAIMGTVFMRELASWGATMASGYTAPADPLEGEIEGIDTVSGATKTSVPFVAALSQARADGYIKGVSENVNVTIDGERAADDANRPSININEQPQDITSCVKNADGTYTIKVITRHYGGGRLSLDNVFLYNMSDKKLGTQGMMTLAKQSSPLDGADFNEEDFVYTPMKLYRGAQTTGRNGQVSYASLVSYNAAAENVTLFDDEYINLVYSNTGGTPNTLPVTITTKDKSITHVVLKYTLGHGSFAVAYDLEDMVNAAAANELMGAAKGSDAASVTAARAAYNALPYDVRPFATNIDNLQAAEAELVAAALSSADATNATAVAAARAAYEALDANAKAKVDAAAVSKLEAAEKAIEDAKKQQATPKTPVAKKATQTITAAKATYTVKFKKVKKAAQKIKVAFKANGGGALSWAAAKSGKVSIAKNGKVTVKKGAKKGTYTLRVKVTAAAKGNFAQTNATVPVNIKVK